MNASSDLPPNKSPRWILTARLAALASLLMILVPWYVIILGNQPRKTLALLLPLFFAPFWGPYLWIAFRLRSESDLLATKKSLALAVAWGVLGFGVCTIIALLVLMDTGFTKDEWKTSLCVGAFLAIQILLIVSSAIAYYSAERDSRDRSLLAVRLSFASLLLLAAFAFLASLNSMLHVSAHPEASAVASLRTPIRRTTPRICGFSH